MVLKDRLDLAQSPTATAPRLSVIIPAYERPNALRMVLDGLAKQTFPMAEFEVIVVIDGAHPGVVELAQTFQWPFALRCFPRPHRGETAARNFGLSQAGAEFIVSLDDDSIPVPVFLERHWKVLESEDRIVVCGDVRRHPQSPQISLAQAYDWSEGHHAQMTGLGHELSYAYLVDNNFSIRKSHLLEAGAWDEMLEGYGGIDDRELGYRLKRLGLRFRFEPEALVYHYFSKSLQSILEHSRIIGRAEVYYFEKYPDAVRDLLFPRLIMGAFWKRWLLLSSRYFPNLILKLISSRVAPWLDKRKILQPSYFPAWFFKAFRAPFLLKGFWDRPDAMMEAYQQLRTNSRRR